MGFHALFQREPVLDILQKTLQSYYNNRYPQQNITVSYEKRDGAAEYFLIPYLGMINQTKPSRQICQQYYSLFNIRGNLLKYVAAKTLVFLGLHFPRLLAMKQRLYIWPREAVGSQTVFSYCNRSIRIFDHQAGTTVSIQKEGFTDKFFQNQLQFRLAHPYDFVPEVLASGQDWFEERIYTGKVLARLTDRQQYQAAQAQTLDHVSRLQADSLKQTPARTYVDDLCQRLTAMLAETAQKKATTTHTQAGEYLGQLQNALHAIPPTLPTVISHKDLQGGNILATAEKLWIIDWETQGRGSRWFDAITMLYGTRYYGGIRRLTQDVRANSLPAAIGDPEGWTAKQILAIFLLEDLEFYLEDMLELPGEAGSATFDRYMTEVLEIDWNQVF